MGPYRDRLRVVAAVLLVAATVLLVVGTSLERSQATSETGQAGGVQREAGEHNQAAEQTTTTHSQVNERAKGTSPKEAAEQTTTSPSQATEPANLTGSNEATEQAQGGHNEPAEQAGSHNEAAESGEELFGIDLEGVGLTVSAAVVSLLLAGLLLTVAGRQVLVAVGLFALAFVALDLRESVHQASEARAGLLAITLLAAVAHLGAAGLASIRLWTPRHTAASP